ncbi:MAG TPA: AmmeMemoRadiSam system protein A [Candidatus Competibacteraceae bacterium]|nr:AmmeMemoRadiSam system protein A [Candidatus Competibacteraceae bacterium]
MAPMPCTEPELSEVERATLLAVARQSILLGLEGQRLLPPVDDYPPLLREHRASFVTLEREGDLRGCIGTLQARQPLVRDVSEHAHAAAFADPRFLPLTRAELSGLELHISVLSPLTPLLFADEHDLLRQLRPGIDGLVLRLGRQHATFLPSVWEHLPEPRRFLAQLKRKAGLPTDFWSDELCVERYTVEIFSDPRLFAA